MALRPTAQFAHEYCVESVSAHTRIQQPDHPGFVEHSKVAAPIPSIETTIGAKAPKVTIQLPEVTRIQIKGRFEMQPGETLVIASTDPTVEKGGFVLVRVKRVAEFTEGR